MRRAALRRSPPKTVHPIRAFQWDLARQVERLDVLLELLPRYAAWGYQELYLHLEDAIDYPSLPGIAREDAYSFSEFNRLVKAAGSVGIGVVPIVNLLGHTQYLIKSPALRDLNELRNPDGSPQERGQICPLHPRTLEVAEKLIQDMAPLCTAGKIHVGLDESFHLGQCPRCRAEIEKIGLGGHFARYVTRLHQQIKPKGLRLGLWADMLNYIPEAIPLLPRGTIAYDWFYYRFARHPRVELYNFAESDLSGALRAQGIAYWGCPMNGAFRYEPIPLFNERLDNIQSWWKRCQQTNAEGFLVTSWEAYRLALETTTIVDATAASLWLEPSATGTPLSLQTGLRRVFDRRRVTPAIRAAALCDRYPFSGYARWEINHRWDLTPAHVTLKPFVAEEKAFRHFLDQFASELPPALAGSLRFRYYLAQRDLFVRQTAQSIFQARQLLLATKKPSAVKTHIDRLHKTASAFAASLAAGRKAARLMWNQTRDPKRRGQNQLILDDDARRLAEARRWLKRCRRNLELLRARSPFCDRWQLQLVVRNFAPALQKVTVEQHIDGQWTMLASRYTIEFQAAAARPKADIRRHFVAPLTSLETPIRIGVYGVGEVEIRDVAITDGASFQPLKIPPKRLGRPVVRRGFPRLDLDKGSFIELPRVAELLR